MLKLAVPASRLLPVASLLACACVGEIGPSSGAGTTPAAVPDPGSAPASDCTALTPEPLARLSRQEYLNTVADILQIAPPSASSLPEDGYFGGFKTTAGQALNAPLAEKYVDAAQAVAEAVLSEQAQGVACSAADESTCIAELLRTTGARLFRRALRDGEAQHYLALFGQFRASAGFDEAASMLLQALLLAPQFLFHLEERAPGQVEGQAYALTDAQLAARLSYLFWQTAPDAELRELAARGALQDDATLSAQAQRLMQHERARPVMSSFLSQWLKLEDIERIMVDPVKEPSFTPELLSALAEETRAHVEHAFWNGNDTVAEILVSPTRFRNQKLSSFYGDALAQGGALTLVATEPSERAFGLLSQAGFLATISRNQEAAIIYRGRFVREKLLCGTLTLPPPDLVSPLPHIEPGTTGRQRVEQHTSGPACIGCHQLMNPFGFALEHFDYLGRFRESDAGLPIDASLDDPELGSISGALELSRRLAESDAVAACAAEHALEFALGHRPVPDERCGASVPDPSAPRNLRDVLSSLPLGRAFKHRVEPLP
jgi:hypothetical protein